MGITIQYQGQINNKDQVFELIEEIKDISQINGWPYHTLNESWDHPPAAHFTEKEDSGIKIQGNCGLKGIHFDPHPKCESVWLYFNARGMLSAPLQVALESEENYPMKRAWLSTQTQYAGPRSHMALISILKYLKAKYIHDLEVKDDGKLWETGSVPRLKERFKEVNVLLGSFEKILQQLEYTPGDTAKTLAEKIDVILRSIEKQN